MRLPSILAIILILLFLVIASGCSTPVPVTMKFPEATKSMLATCPDLKKVDENTTKLSDIVETVTNNYQLYYDCKANIDDWIEWYNGQKKIFESVK
jgi:hypothetical protein